MQPEELMDAKPSWFADKRNSCFTLKLFTIWKVYDDPDIESRSEFLATNFALPEEVCNIPTASICPGPYPITDKEEDDKPDDEFANGDVCQVVDDSENADEDEDNGVVWLHDADREGNHE